MQERRVINLARLQKKKKLCSVKQNRGGTESSFARTARSSCGRGRAFARSPSQWLRLNAIKVLQGFFLLSSLPPGWPSKRRVVEKNEKKMCRFDVSLCRTVSKQSFQFYYFVFSKKFLTSFLEISNHVVQIIISLKKNSNFVELNSLVWKLESTNHTVLSRISILCNCNNFGRKITRQGISTFFFSVLLLAN